MNHNALSSDLDYILSHTRTVWEELKNQTIFITGGTGFIGTWLLETLVWANQQLNLNLSVIALTRNAEKFLKKMPHASRHIQFLVGDVKNFTYPKSVCSYMIHAATEASETLNRENPQSMIETIIQGTHHVLHCAAVTKTKKFLFLSSGAVYGKQAAHIEKIHENENLQPDATNAYALGKYQAEIQCMRHAEKYQYEMKIARCFAFVGPYLPLDLHFAIGNFIRDGLMGKEIEVNGDGSPYRSYLYAADLVICLLRILCHSESGQAYNVGSDEAINIADLAMLVSECFDQKPSVKIAKTRDGFCSPQRYIPSVERIKTLGLPEKISLADAILKTIAWHKRE